VTKTKQYILAVILLMAPLAAGSAMVLWMLRLDTKDGLPIYVRLLSLAFILFWAWAGSRFAALNMGRLSGFLLGNSATIIFFLLYLLFGHQAGADALSHWLALLSGIYVVPLTGVLDLLPSVLGAQAIAYLLLIMIFSAGFFCKLRKGSAIVPD